MATRKLGSAAATALVVGYTIAVGIFLTPAEAFGVAASPALTLGLWITCGLLVLAGGGLQCTTLVFIAPGLLQDTRPPMSALPPIETTAESIDEVVDRLSTLIEWARASRSRLGYFAALYRKVTVRVRDGIRAGHFDDNARMERFDVAFANRYLQALVDVRSGTPPSRVWGFAFDATAAYWPIVLQHLLLGMNAHINLDLGIAAAETMRGKPLERLRGDFDRINEVLASLVKEVQDELARIWMTLRVLNAFLGDVDDALIGFSMEHARAEAWRAATRFSALPEPDWPAAIREQDEKLMPLARLVRSPGVLLGAVTRFVRLGEVQDVARVTDILAGRAA